MMMESLTFGTWLKRKRKSLDLTRAALAARVGCSAATIRKVEDEERRPSVQIAGLLADVFGIPARDLPAFLRFARGEVRAASAFAAELLPWQPETAGPRIILPAPVTSLVGRQDEIAEVRACLARTDVRLLTLIGPPGIGKTRLGIESGRASAGDFPDGVFFVALAQLDDPALAAATVVKALGFADRKSRSALEMLKGGIGDQRMLLVLDNCEHLIGMASQLAADLLDACPRLKILATSRESLRIPGEWLVSLPPLGMPPASAAYAPDWVERYPALALFVERARAVRPDFALAADNFQAVVEICSQLDGLPLAIELIAARIRLMSPQSLLERMTGAFVLSADGMRAVSARQKTLGAAIAWNVNTLPPEEHRLFIFLSIFAGGFTLETVEAVFGPLFAEHAIPDLLMGLVDKSLVQRSINPRGELRFGMLGVIQQFALARMQQSASQPDLRDRHLAYFIGLAGHGEQALRGPDQAAWCERLEDEVGNFRAALEWSVSSRQAVLALQLLAALGWPWEVSGHYTEMRMWLERVRALPGAADHPGLVARVLNHVGRHSWTQEEETYASQVLEESCAIARSLGEEGEPILAEALNWLGLIRLFYDRDAPAAREMFARSLAINERRALPHQAAVSIFHLGLCESWHQNDAAAITLLERSLALFRRSGDLFFEARVSLFLGYVYLRQGKYELARSYFEARLRLDTEINFIDGIAEGWRDLGNYYHQLQLLEQASDCYETCLRVCREHGLQKNEAWYRAGLIALQMGRYELARQRFSYALRQVRRSGIRSLSGVLLMGMAAAESGVGQWETAARLFGAGRAVIESSQEEFPDAERIELERGIQAAQAGLGDAAFKLGEVEGRAISLEQAVALALLEKELKPPPQTGPPGFAPRAR